MINRRQSRAERKVMMRARLASDQRRRHDIERLRVPLSASKAGAISSRSPDFEVRLEAKRAGRCLNLTHLQHRVGIADIDHDRQPAKRRDTSRKSSSRLPANRSAGCDRPVTLPPGRARLATRPPPTGSPATAKTIGMTEVACLAAGLRLRR